MNQYPVRKIWNEYDRGIIRTVYNLVIFSQKESKIRSKILEMAN